MSQFNSARIVKVQSILRERALLAAINRSDGYSLILGGPAHKHPGNYDIGSQTVKCGYSLESSCRAVVPTLIGRQPGQKPDEPVLIGEEVVNFEGRLIRQYPVDRSIITNWAHMEALMRHLYSKTLVTKSNERGLVVTSHLYPRMNRERLTQIVFEEFEVPSFYMVEQATASLYASDLASGIVLTSGYGACHTVAIHEGHTLGFAMQHSDVAGYEISNYVRKLLGEAGVGEAYNRAMDPDVEAIKKMAITLPASFADESIHTTIPYTLFDGSVLEDIGPIIRKCTEPFFNTQIIDNDFEPIHQSIATCALKCHSEIRPQLLSNIVLSGGNTLFQGLPERLGTELSAVLPKNVSFQLHAPSDRIYSSWKGASKLANRSEFLQMAISKQEYDEYGPAISGIKCF